jgi:pyrimidine deaminase RibD-like protein
MASDRDLMILAVEQAKKCVAEDQRNPRPLVGAVIVDDDRVAIAYRGEHGPGEHAEFTLLKRLEWKPKAATLFTTLEPCVTRGHSKRPCADRIVDAKGISRVVIGMLDPNPSIAGKGILRLREADIDVSLFDPDLMRQLEDLNRAFIGSYRPLSARISSGVLPIDGHDRRLDDWYVAVNSIYLRTNFHRSADSILAHLVEVIGGLGPLASGKKTEIVPTEHVAKSLAWWMALCGKIGVKSVENMLWAKFPGVCPYCLLNPHQKISCKTKKEKSKQPDWAALNMRAGETRSEMPARLLDWQKLFGSIYEVPPIDFVIAKLTEELGELAEAVRVRGVKPGYFLNEASDVFAWLMQLQNAIDEAELKEDSEIGEPLSAAFVAGYPDRCSRCQNQICSCPPVAAETIGRIAHDMPASADSLLSIEDTLELFGRWHT